MDVPRVMWQRGNMTASRGEPDQKFAVEKLDVYGAAVELLVLLDRLFPHLWRRNSALCRQLQRALASILTNIGEAASCMSPADRRRYFEYAYRSAGECAAAILAFEAIGALQDPDAQAARRLLHRIQAMLMRLMQRARRLSTP